jgi:hypothetical protein
MKLSGLSPEEGWIDLFQALDFANRRFADWQQQNRIGVTQLKRIKDELDGSRERWLRARDEGRPVPADTGLAAGWNSESPASRSLRYWIFVDRALRRLDRGGALQLAQVHDLQAEVRAHQASLERRLAPEEIPEVQPAVPVAKAVPPDDTPAADPRLAAPMGATMAGRRNLLEILLDPRNIQMLLAFGGALIVIGLVILLWVNHFFRPPVIAIALGVVNALALGLGWWMLRATRYHTAGRALTLLACLVMPLNLWYYHANQLITLDGHLWVAALVISVLYAASAWVLQDELFVYVFVAGLTLTGLLLLADLPPSPEKFWEIASPATLLVVLGLIAIHLERVFPELEGPFGRRRFGLAFFWSGHALLASGLLLVLGAEIAGDWLYRPVFVDLYQLLHAKPSPIVGELRWLALALVLAGTYGYVYSDLVVRHRGLYVHVAAGTLLWAFVLLLQVLNLRLDLDAFIALLAVAALVVNGVQATALRDSRYTRAFPVLGVLLPLLAVVLGLVAFVRALSPDLKSVWQAAPPSWSYVGAMLLTAVSCRLGAYLYRQREPHLAIAYFFATAAALLVGATALLAALGLDTWQQHAPLLMLLPILYLAAAHLYGSRPERTALLWAAHGATVLMLLSSLASTAEGFGDVRQQPLNLVLALFFAEATLFYGLATALSRQGWMINAAAATGCAALWQLLTYLGVTPELYILTFALVGLGLLLIYRFALVERLAAGPVAQAVFQSANTLLSLSLIAALLFVGSRLATEAPRWSSVALCAAQTAISLLAVLLVRHVAWRRWYVIAAITEAALAFLALALLSELSPLQRLEVFCVAVGLLLLVAGHIGWYREQDRQNDLVSLSLLLGSLLVGVPLAAATLIDRSRDHFIFLNEIGFLAAALLLTTTGFLFQLKSTTLVGAGLTALYFVTLLIFVPWSRLNAVAICITAGGFILFLLGLVLSLYRDRLLTLPARIKRREGLFRVLNWR